MDSENSALPYQSVNRTCDDQHSNQSDVSLKDPNETIFDMHASIVNLLKNFIDVNGASLNYTSIDAPINLNTSNQFQSRVTSNTWSLLSIS